MQSIIKSTFNPINETLTAGGSAVTYTYDANGTKLRKVVTGTSALNNDYISGIHYEAGVLKFLNTAEGRVVRNSATSYSYEYTLADHLGNGRVYFDVNASNVAVKKQETDYYAFGLEIDRVVPSPKNLYLYNGKEKQEQEKLFDYGARFYDPVIGRFSTVDPLADEFDHMSPYNYAMNNPILMIDPDGMAADTTKKITPKPKPESKPVQLNEVTVRGKRTIKSWSGTYVIDPVATQKYMDMQNARSNWFIKRFTPLGRTLSTMVTVLNIFDLDFTLKTKSYDANDQELPTLDNTGKVHGDLPDPNDMKKFPKEKLKQFLRDLKKSVQQRQSLNKSLGVDPGHATRVAQESRLIRVVTKILSGS